MKRYFLAFSAMLLCTLFVGLSAPYSASAQSAFDDAYNSTDVLTLQHYGYPGDVVDVTNHLGSLLNGQPVGEIENFRYFYGQNGVTCTPIDQPCTTYLDVLDDFNNAGAWSITQINPYAITIAFIPDSILLLDWAIWEGDPYIQISPLNTDIQYITLFYNTPSQGTLDITYGYTTYYEDGFKTYISYKAGFPNLKNFLVNSASYNYPPGYGGPQIPETHTPVDTTPPEFQFTYSVADKQITLYDLSKLSLDQTACYFQINPNGTQVNTELHFDCDTQNSVTHTVDEYGLYDVTLMYVTPDGLKSSIILTLDIDGSSFSDTYGYAVNDIFYKCISSELPFINFTECYNNVLIFANMLAFDRLHFGTDFTPPEGCRDLVVLGDWIGASTNTVCPMIPSYVRDVTTPFVTFLLGLLMLKFITSRAGGGFS